MGAHPKRRGGEPTREATRSPRNDVRTVEVHLEELGEHSWIKALVNTLGGSYGSAQLRFVARAEGEGHKASDHVATGATFPAMRAGNLDDRDQPNAWLETALGRLDELDEELCAAGWRRCVADGRHWWSRTYAQW